MKKINVSKNQLKDVINLSKEYLRRIENQYITGTGDPQIKYLLYENRLNKEITFLKDCGINDGQINQILSTF
jgi:hypothetical protein